MGIMHPQTVALMVVQTGTATAMVVVTVTVVVTAMAAVTVTALHQPMVPLGLLN